jgi:hypothetical protein
METENIELSDRDSLQAQQILVDSDRETEKLGLLDDELKKHEAVETALHLLASNGIRAYIYADIPTSSTPPGIPTVYQFNTIGSFFEYDENGNRTEQSLFEGQFFHSVLWVSLVENTITFSELAKYMGVDKLDLKEPTTHRKRMQFMDTYITLCYRDAREKTQKILSTSHDI